jgi:hypothetical protein
VYRPRRELQKVAPRNFDAFFAKRQKKTVEIPPVPGREGAARFCNSRLQQGDPSFVCRNQAAETKEGKAMTNHHHNQITTSRRDRRSAKQGRATVRIFPLAVYATCNPVRYARDRQQRSNEARRWRPSPVEAKRIERLHQSGQTLKQIGASLGINRNIIPRELREHGIVLPPHPSITPRRMSLLDAEVAQIRTMQKQGRTMAYIAEEVCVCVGVIRRELRARGLPTRTERRRRAVKKSIRGWWSKLGDDPDTYRKVED